MQHPHQVMQRVQRHVTNALWILNATQHKSVWHSTSLHHAVQCNTMQHDTMHDNVNSPEPYVAQCDVLNPPLIVFEPFAFPIHTIMLSNYNGVLLWFRWFRINDLLIWIGRFEWIEIQSPMLKLKIRNPILMVMRRWHDKATMVERSYHHQVSSFYHGCVCNTV